MKTQQPSDLKFEFEFEDLPARDRLREIILHIATQCEDEPNFSATMLNKILVRADFLAYAKFGKPITGVAYMRLPYGPVPVPILPVKNQMIADRELFAYERDHFGHPQQRIIALREADLDVFEPREIALIDKTIAFLCQYSAKQVSDMSHGVAWQAAKEREKIPYNAVFLSDEGITDEDIYLTQELVKENGWQDL